jgi:tRNA(fMet)-specific endonuclease VapC
MIFILDSDCLTILQRQTEPFYSRLVTRLQQFPDEDICTTIINFEEQMRGWMAFIADSKQIRQEITAYNRLHALLTFYSDLVILDFDESAAEEFSKLKQLKLRIGSMDLKIAAITLSKNGTLLSRNIRDFKRIPNLQIADWTL